MRQQQGYFSGRDFEDYRQVELKRGATLPLRCLKLYVSGA